MYRLAAIYFITDRHTERQTTLQVCYALCRHSQEYISLCLKYSVDAGSCSLSAICSAVMNKFDSVVNVPGVC